MFCLIIEILFLALMNKVDTERLKHLMERMNDFFHQPLNFEKKEEVMSFAMKIYPEIQYFYYDLIPRLLDSELSEDVHKRVIKYKNTITQVGIM